MMTYYVGRCEQCHAVVTDAPWKVENCEEDEFYVIFLPTPQMTNMRAIRIDFYAQTAKFSEAAKLSEVTNSDPQIIALKKTHKCLSEMMQRLKISDDTKQSLHKK